MQQRTQRIPEHDDDHERRSADSREHSNDSRHGQNENEENKQKEAEKKKKRQIKPRFKFESKHLKDKNKGLRLFYESAAKLKTETNNGENRNDVRFYVNVTFINSYGGRLTFSINSSDCTRNGISI